MRRVSVLAHRGNVDRIGTPNNQPLIHNTMTDNQNTEAKPKTADEELRKAAWSPLKTSSELNTLIRGLVVETQKPINDGCFYRVNL